MQVKIMENSNPLKSYFRQPHIFLKLPTGNRWYTEQDVDTSISELPIYAMRAIDDIMLNTPDAMLNGHALWGVISSCVPSIKNVKNIKLPDLDAIYVAIKASTHNGVVELKRTCASCNEENLLELNCQHLLDTMTVVEESDCYVELDGQLLIQIQPYNLEMKQMFMHHQFEEEKTIKILNMSNPNQDEFAQAAMIAESVERLSQLTFELVSKSITGIKIIESDVLVDDPKWINEWLQSISKEQADQVITAVNTLNQIGINKNITISCSNCAAQWQETLDFEPTSFFDKRS
jgi:hypothetical protein